MEIMLEKIVAQARLGWVGVTMTVSGAIIMGVSLKYLLDDAIGSAGAGLAFGSFNAGGSLAGFGIGSYRTARDAFRRTEDNIAKLGHLESRFIEPYLKEYCTRQAARTAAVHYNLSSEFDELVEKYNGEMRFSYLPLL